MMILFNFLGTEICVIDASSQTHVNVVVLPYDNATSSRVDLIPVSVGVNSTYRVVTKVDADREVHDDLIFNILLNHENISFRASAIRRQHTRPN